MRAGIVALAVVVVACTHTREQAPPPPVAWPVDVSPFPGNQMETAAAVDPRDGDHVVVASNNDAGRPPGLFLASTADGGRTWTRAIVARDGAGGLPDACCDPRLAWDAHGAVFLTYLALATPDEACPLGRSAVVFAVSTDGGTTFSDVRRVADGCLDQPKVAVGADTVWVAYRSGADVVAQGARVTGPGVVAAFGPPVVLPGSRSGNYASVSVGPDGEVLVAYVTKQLVAGRGVRTVVRANADPDGLGPRPFDAGHVVAETTVTNAERLAAQPHRGTDPQPNVAFDTGEGTRRGRAYIAYLDRADGGTRVAVRASGDGGVTWGAAVVVAPGARPSAQLLPALAVDPGSGRVGVTYFDTALDTGSGGDDTDGAPDTDADRYATVSGDGAMTFGTPVRLSRKASNAGGSAGIGLDYGDYTGMAYADGVLVAAWADNSDSTGGNPDGARKALDVYVTALRPPG